MAHLKFNTRAVAERLMQQARRLGEQVTTHLEKAGVQLHKGHGRVDQVSGGAVESGKLDGVRPGETWLDPAVAARIARTNPVHEVLEPGAVGGSEVRGADLFLQALKALGVEYVPGNYGVTELGFTMTAAEHPAGVAPLLVMQEQVAAGMIHGQALATGKPGVAFAHGTLGLGAMSALVYNLKQDGVPGVVVLGNAGDLAGSMMQTQDTDGLPGAVKMAEGAGAKRVFVATDPAAIPKLMKDAAELAVSGKPGPVVVVLPDQDVMRKAIEGGHLSPITPPKPPMLAFPNPDDVQAMSKALAKAKHPIIVVGNELARNGPEAVKAAAALAEKTGARVYGLMENYVAFPRDNPLFVGQAGAVDGRGWPKEMGEADAVIYLGTHTDQMAVFPGAQGPYSSDAQVFLVGTDPDLAVRAYQGDQVLASPGPTVDAVLKQLDGQMTAEDADAAKRRVSEISSQTQAAGARMMAAAHQEAQKMAIHPVELAEALAKALKGRDDVIVLNEGIGYSGLFEQALAPSQPGEYFAGRGGALGIAGPVGSGLAAATGKTVIAISGDGAFNYTPQWLATAREQGLNVIEIVLKNDEYRFLDVAVDDIAKRDGIANTHPNVHQLGRNRETGERIEFDYTQIAAAYDVPAVSLDKREQLDDVIAFITGQIGKPNPSLVQMVIRHPQPEPTNATAPATTEPPATVRGGDLFLEALKVLGIDHVPGNYGVTELGFTMTAAERPNGVEPMLVMQEMTAAGIIHGEALVTHKPGVAFAHGTLGLGAMSALVYNLKQDGVAGVVVLGNAGDLAGSMMQTQDTDGLPGAVKMAEGAGAKRVFIATDPLAIPKLMRDAVELAVSGKPGPVVVVIPDQDVMRKELPADSHVELVERKRLNPKGSRGTAMLHRRGRLEITAPKAPTLAFPSPAAIDEMSAVLAKAKHPIIVVGNELARNGPEAVEAAAELAKRTGARVYGLMENHLAFPRDNPLFVGQAGAVDGRGWPAAMREADAVIYLGTHTDQMAVFPGAEGPYPADAKVFLVGTDPDLAVRAYQGDQMLFSPGPTVNALLEKLDGQMSADDRAAAEQRVKTISAETRAAGERMMAAAHKEAEQMELHPVEFAEALAQALEGRDDVIVLNEGIGYAGLFEQALAPSSPGDYFAGRGGALGIAGPVGTGIAKASGKTVIAISGDGAFNYTPQWIATAREQGLNVIEIVLKNDEYRFLNVAVDDIAGRDHIAPTHPDVHNLAEDRRTGERIDFDYTKFAAAYGSPGLSISKREEIGQAIDFIKGQIGQKNPSVVQLVIRHPPAVA